MLIPTVAMGIEDIRCPFPIHIILIDEATISALGPLPWPRDKHAKLVNILNKAGARAIALAFYFRDPGKGKGDDALAAAIKKSGKVYLSTGMTDEAPSWEPQGTWWGRVALNAEGTAPKAVLDAKHVTLPIRKIARVTAGLGATDRLVNKKKKLGSLPLFIRHESWFIPSLGFRLFLDLKGMGTAPLAFKKGKQVIIEGRKISVDKFAGAMVNLTSPGSAYPIHGFSEVLGGKVPAASFKNAIVLVGMADPNTDIITATGRKNSLELVADQLTTLYENFGKGGK